MLESLAILLLAVAPQAPGKPKQVIERSGDRKICHKQIEAGALIKGRMVCMTAKEWQRVADAWRDEVERTASLGSRSSQ